MTAAVARRLLELCCLKWRAELRLRCRLLNVYCTGQAGIGLAEIRTPAGDWDVAVLQG